MNINDLIAEAHANAVAHGFWEENRPFAEQIALMHSELSEALEEFRDGKGLNETYYSCTTEGPGRRQNCLYPGRPCPAECPNQKPEGIPIELADAIIRICDACGQYGIDLDRAIRLKMEYNKTRPYKHGKKI